MLLFIMNRKQIRDFGTSAKGVFLICLLAIPAVCLVAPRLPVARTVKLPVMEPVESPVANPVVMTLPPGSTSVEIQQALDSLPASGGEVVLPAGSFEVCQPIVLKRDHLTLRGSGVATILRLDADANCPVI